MPKGVLIAAVVVVLVLGVGAVASAAPRRPPVQPSVGPPPPPPPPGSALASQALGMIRDVGDALHIAGYRSGPANVIVCKGVGGKVGLSVDDVGRCGQYLTALGKPPAKGSDICATCSALYDYTARRFPWS
jgi:hypothetical protein